MLYFPPSAAAMSAVNARNAISQMNLYGYTTGQSMLPSRRMEMEARGRFMATGAGAMLRPAEMAAYGTLPMPGGGGRAARLRWSDREKSSNNGVNKANDNALCEGDVDDDEDVDENRNNYKSARAVRNKASAGG